MQLVLSILFIIGSPFVIIGILHLFRSYEKQKKLRSPFTQDFLRGPGQSLLLKLNAVNEDLMVYLISALMAPLVVYAIHISMSYFGGTPETYLRMAASACAGIGFFVFFICRAIQRLDERRVIQLGYEGKLAVGQALEQLRHAGFYVYHDFPADKFNIDHVVVGPKGVFAVKTEARSKPTTNNRIEDATVEYDGRMLYFPKGEDFKTIDRAERQASWLSDWLGKAVGEQIAARAIVALPGWFVKRTSSEGIPVANPKQFTSLFEHIKPRTLSESIITRINRQLDQKCRDIEPESKSFDN